MSQSDTPTVHQAIAAVIKDLPAIGKDSVNRDQGYKFRGIEAIKTEVRHALVKHGVFYAPEVREREHVEYPTQRGGVMKVCRLTVAWKLYGPGGDYIEAATAGEGADVADKSTNKAMSAAEKYFLTQVFCIADGDDGDAETPEGQSHPLVERHGTPDGSYRSTTRRPPVPDAAPVGGRHQGSRIFALCKTNGREPNEECSRILKRDIGHTKDLTPEESQQVLAQLEQEGLRFQDDRG